MSRYQWFFVSFIVSVVAAAVVMGAVFLQYNGHPQGYPGRVANG